MQKRFVLTILPFLGVFGLGILIGGYLFSDTQPRSVTAVHRCNATCLNPNELIGLIGAIGMQRFTNIMPFVVAETDKTLVIKNPLPQAPIHYVFVPKKDIKDIGQISAEDQAYIEDIFLVMADIIRKEKLRNYQIGSNGPGFQAVNYLHFHLMANGKKLPF